MRIVATLILLCAAALPALAEDAPPLDGAGQIFNDDLLDKLAGSWRLEGTLVGKPAHHTIQADWILNHQFLQIHEIGEIDRKTGKPGYEALPMIGYDNTSQRYVAHWIDVFGGRFSETLGYGTRHGNQIDFVFEYPDGPFHTSFIWDGTHKQWHWLMSQHGVGGKWSSFADFTLSPA